MTDIATRPAAARGIPMMRIRVLESAEETDIRLADIPADPIET